MWRSDKNQIFRTLVNCQVCFPGEPCGGENKGTGDFGDYFDVKDSIPTEKITTSKYNYNNRYHKVTNNKHVFVIRKSSFLGGFNHLILL